MASSEDSYGDWKKDRVLGSGGFGVVSLWKNLVTSETIALKMWRETSDKMSTKSFNRWTKEVETMLKLSHPNVVRVLPVPGDFHDYPSTLPILCMEYCSKGDLRKVLNCPENCSGLREFDIRCILKDIKSAVEYLHREHLIHRDLKPENIVIQPIDQHNVIYKVIDLGYAKELDQSDHCSSFVGTLQYLAPELFTHFYTCSVDYWSLGLLCHEIITGVRPFLPHMSPFSWMTHIRKKSHDDICVYQNPDGSIEYSQELFAENHITQSLRYEFEKWLRLSLEWDGKKRGRSEDNTLILFSSLDTILSKKIISIFSSVAYEKLSYEIDDSTLVSTLMLWVERDTKQPSEDQTMYLPAGEKLSFDTLVHTCWDPQNEDVMIYLYSRKGLELPLVQPKIPPLVTKMLEEPRATQPYFYLRRSWPNAVFFINSQLNLYQSLLEAYAVKQIALILLNRDLSALDQTMSHELQQIKAKLKLAKDSLDFDVKCYKKVGLKVLDKQQVTEWEESLGKLDQEFLRLLEVGKTLGEKVSFATAKFTKLQNIQESSQKFMEKLKTLLELSQRVMTSLKNCPKEMRETDMDSVEMVKVVYKMLKERDRMLRDEKFNVCLKELKDCEESLSVLMSPLNGLRSVLYKFSNDISRYQLRRQKDLWQQIVNLNDKLSSQELMFTDQMKKLDLNGVTQGSTPVANTSKHNTQVKLPDRILFQVQDCLNQQQSIVQDNQELRYMIQETVSKNVNKCREVILECKEMDLKLGRLKD